MKFLNYVESYVGDGSNATDRLFSGNIFNLINGFLHEDFGMLARKFSTFATKIKSATCKDSWPVEDEVESDKILHGISHWSALLSSISKRIQYLPPIETQDFKNKVFETTSSMEAGTGSGVLIFEIFNYLVGFLSDQWIQPN